MELVQYVLRAGHSVRIVLFFVVDLHGSTVHISFRMTQYCIVYIIDKMQSAAHFTNMV